MAFYYFIEIVPSFLDPVILYYVFLFLPFNRGVLFGMFGTFYFVKCILSFLYRRIAYTANYYKQDYVDSVYNSWENSPTSPVMETATACDVPESSAEQKLDIHSDIQLFRRFALFITLSVVSSHLKKVIITKR